LRLAISWKEIGSTLFGSKQLAEAIESYKKSLELYKLPDFSGNYFLKELPLYSNLVICYKQKKLYSEAITTADAALEVLNHCNDADRPEKLQEKIVFNLIESLCAEAKNLLCFNEPELAQALCSVAEARIMKYQEVLNNKLWVNEITLKLQDIQSSIKKNVPLTPVTDSINNLGIFATQGNKCTPCNFIADQTYKM
jgi:tetratricopeptide (TPR) repeat protein